METPIELSKQIQDILTSRKVVGRPLFFALAGSHSFNLAVETSDKDYFGVYASDVDAVLSPLDPQPELLDSHEPDYTITEVSNFARLLLKGNPKLIEPLFTERFCYTTPEWELLRPHFKSFLTRSVVEHYLSYAAAQLADARGAKGSPAKKYYHTIRLLHEAGLIARGGVPQVYMTGERRDYLMDVRAGRVAVDRLEEDVVALRSAVDASLARAECALHEHADPQVLSRWIVQVRRMHMRDKAASVGEVTSSLCSLKFAEQHAEPQTVALEKQRLFDMAAARVAAAGVCDAFILFCGPSGSALHGTLLHGTVNEDYLAVYAAPTDSILSLEAPPKALSAGHEAPHGTFCKGLLVLEVAHALALLQQGNHRILETLWADYNSARDGACIAYESEAWRRLREQCQGRLVTKSAAKHYWGTGSGLLYKVSNSVNSASPLCFRHLYHAFRLLFAAQQIIKDKAPDVAVTQEDQKCVLLTLRREEGDMFEWKRQAAELASQVEREIAMRWNNAKLGKGQKDKGPQGTSQPAPAQAEDSSHLRNLLSQWIVALRKQL